MAKELRMEVELGSNLYIWGAGDSPNPVALEPLCPFGKLLYTFIQFKLT